MCANVFEIVAGEEILTKKDAVLPESDEQIMTIVYGLLLREDFRRMLIRTECGRDYFTDSDTYVRAPESVGCFRTGATWIVYETDERGTPIIERQYNDPFLAFQDAASRRGLQFNSSESTRLVLHKSLSEEQISKVLHEIRFAISNLEKVDQLMRLTDRPNAVKEDIQVLVEASNRLDVYSRKDKRKINRNTNIYKDKYIICKGCGRRFVFTAGEQEFYAERGFKNKPQRCERCRDTHKVASRNPYRFSIAVCSSCGKYTIIKPPQRKGRPIYCNKCSAKVKIKA